MSLSSSPTRFTIWLILATAVLSTHGCIPVDDLGQYWVDGKTDPELAGVWRQLGVEHAIDDTYMSFSIDEERGMYRQKNHGTDEEDEDPDFAERGFGVRTTQIGNHRFMMLRDEYGQLDAIREEPVDESESDDYGGGLQRYTVKDGRLTIYHLDDSHLAEAIRASRVAGHIASGEDPNDMTPPTLSKLDEATAAFLSIACEDDSLWNAIEYERVPDLARAIQQSRTYPATPETDANRTVEVDQPDFEFFVESRADLLRRHLQASPEWRVFPEGDEIVVYRRKPEKSRWTVSLNGFDHRYGPNSTSIQTREIFRFAPQGGGPFRNRANRNFFTTAPPDAGSTKLNLQLSDQGIESYLAIGRTGLWYEVFEQTPHEPRTLTRKHLAAFAEQMKTLRDAADQIRKRGYAAELMPKGGVNHGEASLSVSDNSAGIYDIHAWVNPGQSGVVYLKAFRTENGEPLSEDRLTWRSGEFLGWSDDPKELFLFNAHITIGDPPHDKPYNARFELWLRPEGNKDEVKLIETTHSVIGWQR